MQSPVQDILVRRHADHSAERAQEMKSAHARLARQVGERKWLTGFRFDPVPQAMVITGIVVAFAASAVAVALILRLAAEASRVTLDPEAWTRPNGGDPK